MAVLRIVANIASPDPGAGKAFYGDILGLDLVMDHGWIMTYAGNATIAPKLSIASQGGNGTPVPDLTVEVDNVDEIHAKMASAGHAILYPLTDEDWGVRRFYVHDPFGKVINILSHRR